METVAIVCLILLTIGVWLLIFAGIYAALQVHRAAVAVEVKAYQTGEYLYRLRDAASAAGQFSGLLRSNWVKALGVALGAAATYHTVRSRRETHSNGHEN